MASVDEAAGRENGLRIDVLSRELLEAELETILLLDRQIPARLMEPWSPEHFRFELPGKWTYSLLARDADGVVGYAIRSRKGDVVHAHRMVVRPDARRRGVGRRLLVQSARIAVANGIRDLTLKVAAVNDVSLAFHHHFGARICGVEGSNLLLIHRCATLAAGG